VQINRTVLGHPFHVLLFKLDRCNLQAVSSRSQEASDVLQLILDSQTLSVKQASAFADARVEVMLAQFVKDCYWTCRCISLVNTCGTCSRCSSSWRRRANDCPLLPTAGIRHGRTRYRLLPHWQI
jgi:hypothetical protein